MATVTKEDVKIEFKPQEMLNATKRLTELMTSEVIMLEKMKLADIHSLYNEKMKLTSALEGYKKILLENPEILKSLPTNIVDQLRGQAIEFERVMVEEEKQLRKARRVHQILMQAIKDTINKNLIKGGIYTKEGNMDKRVISEAKTPPVTLNESI